MRKKERFFPCCGAPDANLSPAQFPPNDSHDFCNEHGGLGQGELLPVTARPRVRVNLGAACFENTDSQPQKHYVRHHADF